MKQDTHDDVINSAEAARILGVNRTTIFRWTKKGTLPVAKEVLRTESYYDRGVVEQLAAERGQKAS